MKTPTNKSEALELLCCLRVDLDMLKAGDWNPDEDSIDASIEVLSAVMDYVEGLQ